MSSPTTPQPTGTQSATRLRLPHAHLPSIVLPGAVVTLVLNADDLRTAVEAATTGASSNGRLVLTGGDEHELGVIAHVPNIGNLPNGEPAAIVQIEGSGPASRRSPDRHGTLATGRPSSRSSVLTDTASTSSIDAATRELRAVLELIAELRRSRRLPEILRTQRRRRARSPTRSPRGPSSPTPTASSCCAPSNLSDRVDADPLAGPGTTSPSCRSPQSIRDDVSEGVDKQQREYLLRQQLGCDPQGARRG